MRNQIKRDQRDDNDYPRCSLPKMVSFYKKWPVDNVDRNLGEADANEADADEESYLSVVWHRDIVAAKCILYKGK